MARVLGHGSAGSARARAIRLGLPLGHGTERAFVRIAGGPPALSLDPLSLLETGGAR